MAWTESKQVTPSSTHRAMRGALWCLVLVACGLWSLHAEAACGETRDIAILGVDKADAKLYWIESRKELKDDSKSTRHRSLHYIHLDRPEKVATVRSWPADEFDARLKRLRTRLAPVQETYLGETQSHRKDVTFSQVVTEVGKTDDSKEKFTVKLRVTGKALASPLEHQLEAYVQPHVDLMRIFSLKEHPLVVAEFRYVGEENKGCSLEGSQSMGQDLGPRFYRNVLVFGQPKKP